MTRSFIAHSEMGTRLVFRSMTGHEAISTLFEFRVRLISPTFGVSAGNLLGKDMSIEVSLATELGGADKRFLSGQLVEFGYVGKDDGDMHVYEAVLRPWLWYATRRSDFKIFQFKTVPEILHDVLGPYGFAVEDKLSGSYRAWDYCVQYSETDFNFCSRLMELEGLHYYFEHDQGSHKLVLCDGMHSHAPLAHGPVTVPYHAGVLAAQILEQDFIEALSHNQSIVSGEFAADDYDFKKPNARIDSTRSQPAGHSQDRYQMYDWPGGYTELGDGENYARVRMEQQAARREVIEGQGNLRHMAPGFLFELSRHPNAEENRRYLIEAVTYDFQENALRKDGAAFAAYSEGTSSTSYRQTFRVIPDSASYRTARVTPKPRTTGPQTAVVVGPAGEEIHTDQYGRVKVQFHWDRYGKRDENSSCWIRVSQVWAGSNYGAMHIPRIGQEVIVDFLNGDPDYPIITGRVYNAAQMPPWELPANMTQSGILTRSSKGGTPGDGMADSPGTANALRFEDKAGQEQLWLHAQKDQLTEVENDEDKWVGNDRRKTIDRDEFNTVHRDRTEIVDRNEKINVHGWRTEEVDLDETITIHQNRTERVDLNEKISIGKNRSEDVGLNETIKVGVNRTETVGNNEKVKIGVNQNLTVGSNKQETIGLTSLKNVGIAQMTNIGAAYNLNVGAAWMSNVGFMHTHNVGVKYSTTVGTSYSLSSGKTVSVSAGNTMVHQAGDEMTLVCGASSITLKSDGTISIRGDRIQVNGATLVDMDGQNIHMN